MLARQAFCKRMCSGIVIVIGQLQQKLASLPLDPGCYLMKDSDGTIIYVGKAANLRTRVQSYFRGNDHNLKTRALVDQIRDLDVLLTKTEGEALLLERTLIKHHKPKYNILLRDDKEFPLVRIDLKSDWPRFSKVRRRKDDGAVYLGPFSSASALRSAMQLMYRVFPLIRCSPHEFANARRPCNYYHMKMCLGPCTLPVPREQYGAMVGDAIAFLEGKDRALIGTIRDRMAKAAEQENFELAATLRDQLTALSEVAERQAVVLDEGTNAHFLGFAADDTNFAIHVMQVDQGKMTGGQSFVFPRGLHDSSDDVCQFLIQYYDKVPVPPTLYGPLDLVTESDQASLMHVLGHHVPDARKKVQLLFPQRGTSAQALEIAQRNAAFALEEFGRDHLKRQTVLDLLKGMLNLDERPRRIECIDISNFGGDAVVASNVCFMDGKPAKELYRHYTVKTVGSDARGAGTGPDDFASMREVVTRRIERGLRDGDMPNLLILDGGKGQLGAALDARGAFPQLTLPMAGLAKSRVDKTVPRKFSDGPRHTDERIFLPGADEPIPLPVGSPEHRLLTHLRDEAHRFAITFHRKKRDKASLGSALDSLAGIGPALRKRLFEAFGDIPGMRRASLDQLRAVKGMTQATAVRLHAWLQGENDPDIPM